MVLKINRHHPSAWRNLEDLQVSIGTSRVILENVSVPEQNMVALLYRGVADGQYQTLAEAVGLEPQAATDLIRRLEPLLEKSPKAAPVRKLPALSESYVDSAIAEITRAALEQQADGIDVLRLRQSRVVHVDSLSKAGLGLVRGLVEAGVGKVISHDNRRVQARDLGADGYDESQLGTSRYLAANQILQRAPKQSRLANGNRMSINALSAIDAAVLISQQVIEPRRYLNWQNRHVPHVAITFALDEILVSPMIMPGNSPCLLCLELNRSKVDESWPALSVQLARSDLRFDDVSSRMFANGLAIRQVLSVLDRNFVEPNLPAFTRGYRFDFSTQRVSELAWPKLPSCSCSASGASESVTVLDPA
jgi:hypothetical protein